MKNCGKFTGKYLCLSLFLMKFQALRSVTLLKSDSSKDFFMCILRSFKKTPIWEQLLLNQLGVRCIFFFLNAAEKRRKSIKVRITPECFDELFVLMNDDITINYKYKRCKHTKTKSCYKNILCWFICSFIFFNFSSLWWFKNWFNVFHPTNLMN